MLLPIRTDSPIRRTPYANLALIALNVGLFLLARVNPAFIAFEKRYLVLDADWPQLHQFFTYQFIHAHDTIMHLVGNMLFLWIFGNAVNAKVGQLSYVLLYLAGGVAAGAGFAWGADSMIVGASGAIAAVTTAYLVLYPRSNVTVVYFFFFIGTLEVPSMIMILVKIILWDNLIAPNLDSGPSNVAYSAHLAGYAFGFVVTLIMLRLGALPRDQFDMIAIWRRWTQRRAYASVVRDPRVAVPGRFGRVAAPVPTARRVEPAAEESEPVVALRQEITRALAEHDRTRAADLYEQLLAASPDQVLARQAQLDVANQLYTLHRYPQAAAAYERYLQTYGGSPEADHVRLLLGIIYARDLKSYSAAQRYLQESLATLTDERRREQCRVWLDAIRDEPAGPHPAT